MIITLTLSLTACSSNDAKIMVQLKSFGTEPFSIQRWRHANNTQRASMLFSFMNEHDIKNMNAKGIIGYLGEPNGYYEYDEFPAYIVEHDNQNYLVAFVVNRKNRNIGNVVIKPTTKPIHTQDTIMFVERFGKDDFSVNKWKSANSNQRALMMFSFLTKNDIYKMSDLEIKKKLGQSDANYDNSAVPAYLLAHDGVNYVIAFPYIDTEISGKILEAVINPL